MARRTLACASSFVLATVITAPAFAEEREVPRVGTLVVPGVGGTLLVTIVRIFHRPPAAQAGRFASWGSPPTGLPRTTVVTVWRVAF